MATADEGRPDWRRAEREMNAKLGVEATAASGSQWWQKGDGETSGHPHDTDGFRFQVDEKSTRRRTYSIDSVQLSSWCRRAAADGRVFLLPVRFEARSGDDLDFVVLRLDDFRFLLGMDEVTALRAKAADTKRERDEFEARLSKALMSLDGLASSHELSDRAKSVVFKAIEAIDLAMDGLR